MLEDYLLKRFSELGPVTWKRMFGWICSHIGKNFFAGYKVLDDNVLIMMLILSREGYEKAMETDQFQKFEFGQTWVETEIGKKEDLDEIWPFIKDALDYSAIRKTKSKKR